MYKKEGVNEKEVLCDPRGLYRELKEIAKSVTTSSARTVCID